MKNQKIKMLVLSFAIVLVVNVLIFSAINFLEISYWQDAPKEEVIYNMIAGGNKSDIEYLYIDTNFYISDEDATVIETVLKDTSADKLTKKESYKMLYILNKKHFALFCAIPSKYKDDGTINNIKEPVSQLLVYLYDNSVYIVRFTDERQTGSIKTEYAVYKAEENADLFDVMNMYVDESGDGSFYFTIPEWRERARSMWTIYLAIMIWEVQLVRWLLEKKKLKRNDKIDK